jgi:hypothetical protein
MRLAPTTAAPLHPGQIMVSLGPGMAQLAARSGQRAEPLDHSPDMVVLCMPANREAVADGTLPTLQRRESTWEAPATHWSTATRSGSSCFTTRSLQCVSRDRRLAAARPERTGGEARRRRGLKLLSGEGGGIFEMLCHRMVASPPQRGPWGSMPSARAGPRPKHPPWRSPRLAQRCSSLPNLAVALSIGLPVIRHLDSADRPHG